MLNRWEWFDEFRIVPDLSLRDAHVILTQWVAQLLPSRLLYLSRNVIHDFESIPVVELWLSRLKSFYYLKFFSRHGWSRRERSRKKPVVENSALGPRPRIGYLRTKNLIFLFSYGSETRIVHFIGTAKPWLQRLDPGTKTVTPASGSEHLAPLMQSWWDLFCEKVHPHMSKGLVSERFPFVPFFSRWIKKNRLCIIADWQ